MQFKVWKIRTEFCECNRMRRYMWQAIPYSLTCHCPSPKPCPNFSWAWWIPVDFRIPGLPKRVLKRCQHGVKMSPSTIFPIFNSFSDYKLQFLVLQWNGPSSIPSVVDRSHFILTFFNATQKTIAVLFCLSIFWRPIVHATNKDLPQQFSLFPWFPHHCDRSVGDVVSFVFLAPPTKISKIDPLDIPFHICILAPLTKIIWLAIHICFEPPT